MLKKKMFWLVAVAAAGIMRLGLECIPEPDLAIDLIPGFGGPI